MRLASPEQWLSQFRHGDRLLVEEIEELDWVRFTELCTRHLPRANGGFSLEFSPGDPVRVDVSVRMDERERHRIVLPTHAPAPLVETLRAWRSPARFHCMPHVEIGFDGPPGRNPDGQQAIHSCVAATLVPTERGLASMRGSDSGREIESTIQRVLAVGSLVSGEKLATSFARSMHELVAGFPSGTVLQYVAPLSGRGRSNQKEDQQTRLRLIVCMPTAAWFEWTARGRGVPAQLGLVSVMRHLGMRWPSLSFDIDLTPDGIGTSTGLYFSVRAFNHRDNDLRAHLCHMIELFPKTKTIMELALRWSENGSEANGRVCQGRAVTTKLRLEHGVPVGAKVYLSLFGYGADDPETQGLSQP
ncbi:MAG: hypothetical protein V3V08_17195 [Nannocystaceae bacterium]